MTNNQLVGEFHDAFGVAEPARPSLPADAVVDLRINLMREELREVLEAIEDAPDCIGGCQCGPDCRFECEEEWLAHLAKELADLLVVTYGTARAFGIDIDPVFAEVMRSNMSKLDENGRPIYREDGKVLKGPLYREADVAPIIAAASLVR